MLKKYGIKNLPEDDNMSKVSQNRENSKKILTHWKNIAILIIANPPSLCESMLTSGGSFHLWGLYGIH